MAASTSNSNALTRGTSDYWEQSKRPLTSLFFVIPFLLIYEGGMLLMGPDALRNGADVWLRQLLDLVGFGEYFLLPALTIASLLVWHYLKGDPWKVNATVLYGMAAESAVLAMGLVMFAYLQQKISHILFAATSMTASPWLAEVIEASWRGQLGTKWFFGEMVRYFGAGIYEEVLFRLILFSLVLFLVRLGGARPGAQMVVAVVITSFLFSAAHYVGEYGDTLQLNTFVFRFIAGAFFATLFYYRGFGIAVGTHALYDVYAGLQQ